MRTGGQALVDRAQAVLEERCPLGGRRAAGGRPPAPPGERRRLEERHDLVEHRRVAGRPHVVRDGVRQPQQVVRAAGARAPAARLVPPVLDVALDELAAGRPQQVLAREVGPDERERHHVLELVAEAEGAARLVVAGSRPQPAAQVLVEEPAVHQEVEGIVRRAHLHRIERLVPRPAHGVERFSAAAAEPWRTTSSRAAAASCACPSRNTSTRVSPGSSVTDDVQRRTGVEARAEAAGERLAGERRRPRQRAVAAEERRPVARRRAQGLAGVGEGHLSGVLGVVGIAREDGTRLGVELRADSGVTDPREAAPGSTRCRRRRSGGAGGRSRS